MSKIDRHSPIGLKLTILRAERAILLARVKLPVQAGTFAALQRNLNMIKADLLTARIKQIKSRQGLKK